jgi:hypothetical protein
MSWLSLRSLFSVSCARGEKEPRMEEEEDGCGDEEDEDEECAEE